MPRSVTVTILWTPLLWWLSLSSSFAQTPDEPVQPPLAESPPPLVSQPEDHRLPEPTSREPQDVVTMVGELRSAVRLSPQNAVERLKLAQGLYRLGDLDAAIDECRAAIKLVPDDATAHVQLGVMLMAKQEWRAAASVLKEAVRLDPESAHAHYNLGSAHYSLGQAKAAIQSYRQALTLQPYFPDARYRLALLLKLTHQEQEAARLLEEAALGGVPQARFFLGTAYKNGQGVERNLGRAVFWWTAASELGHQQAADALSKLRRLALSPDQPERRRTDALDAFQAYRNKLWDEFPDDRPTGNHDTLGVTLLKQQRGEEAVSALLKECYALSDVALADLAKLYETGLGGHLAPFGKRILACFETTAAEGFVPAKKYLARIYAKGLGVPVDPEKAKAALQGLSKTERKALLDELGASSR